MSLKLFLFLGLVALTTIEARHFLKNLQKRDLTFQSTSKLSQKTVVSLSRSRRDAEASTEITDEKFLIEVAWLGDKLKVLSEFLDRVSNHDNNLTVIGWQRVLDGEGKIKEIRTVQLVIPTKPENDRPNNIEQDEDDDDDERILPHDVINDMRKYFDSMDALGIPTSITQEEFDKEGKLETLLYLDKDELYVNNEGFAILNKTSVASSQDVSSFIGSLKPKGLGKPSVLKYDVDGKLLVDQSHIRPHLLGSVNDFYETPDNILREGPQIIAQISQQYPKNEIPKQLALHYNKAYPEYKWGVLDDPQNRFITRDVEIELTYDNFDFDENSFINYVVYGIKKTT